MAAAVAVKVAARAAAVPAWGAKEATVAVGVAPEATAEVAVETI